MTAHRLKCSHPLSAVHFVRTWRERTCDRDRPQRESEAMAAVDAQSSTERSRNVRCVNGPRNLPTFGQLAFNSWTVDGSSRRNPDCNLNREIISICYGRIHRHPIGHFPFVCLSLERTVEGR